MVRVRDSVRFRVWGAFFREDFFLEPEKRIQNAGKHTTELSAKMLKTVNYFCKKFHFIYFIFLFLKF